MSNGGVEITEIPDDRRRSKKDRRSKEADINGNHQKHGEYHIRELEKDTSRLDVNDGATSEYRTGMLQNLERMEQFLDLLLGVSYLNKISCRHK